MIPKKIHYCWFGHGEKPKLAQKCIASWKKYCPDYEIIEWNEDNFDVNLNGYTKMCYEQKKWAFLSDFARLVIVYENGGIYLDTDVEMVRPFDPLLQYDAFFGFENEQNINTGEGFGAVKKHIAVKVMLDEYLQMKATNEGEHLWISCPTLNTRALIPYGLHLDGKGQKVIGAKIFPSDYFNPYDDPTGRMMKTGNTYSIHWYSKSWLSKRTVLRSKLTKPLHRLLGTEFFAAWKRRK